MFLKKHTKSLSETKLREEVGILYEYVQINRRGNDYEEI